MFVLCTLCTVDNQNVLQQFPFKAIPVWLVQFGNITRLLLSKSINWSTEGAQLLLAMSQLQSLEDFRVFININYRSTVRVQSLFCFLGTNAFTEELYTIRPEEPQGATHLL